MALIRIWPYTSKHRLAVLLAIIICVTCALSTLVLAVPARDARDCQQQVTVQTAPISIERRGWRSMVVRELTELLAKAIRNGGEMASWVIEKLDKKAARAFKKHARSIAGELDKIAKIPDLTTQIVKEKLYYFLHKELSLSGGTALQIADLVKAALDFFLF